MRVIVTNFLLCFCFVINLFASNSNQHVSNNNEADRGNNVYRINTYTRTNIDFDSDELENEENPVVQNRNEINRPEEEMSHDNLLREFCNRFQVLMIMASLFVVTFAIIEVSL